MKIRKATKKDVQGIKEKNQFGQILERCSPLDHLDQAFTPKNEKDYYLKFITSKNKWCYLAEEDNKIVGFILFNLEKRDHFWRVKAVGYVDLVFVVKDYRKKGIGKLLLNKAYQIFKEKKIDYVKLSCQLGNMSAHKVWKHLGFKDYRVDMYKKLK